MQQQLHADALDFPFLLPDLIQKLRKFLRQPKVAAQQCLGGLCNSSFAEHPDLDHLVVQFFQLHIEL